jgi:hypothetical protein
VATRNEILEQKKRKRIEGVLANWQDGEPTNYQFSPLQPRDPMAPQPAVRSQPQQAGPAQPQRPQGTMLGRVGAAIGPMLATPQRQPQTSPRPEVPEQTTAAAPPQPGDPQAELRNRILMKNREREINSKRMALGMTSAYGPDGQINMDRADTLRSMGDELDAVRGSMAPIQKPQTVEQVQASRTGIREQGMGQVAVMRKRAFEADKAGDAETAQKLYDEARRMEVGFRTNLPDHSPESAQEIVGRQEAGAERAEARRGAFGELATAQGNDGESLMRQQIAQRKHQERIDQLARSRDESMLGGDIRENEARGRLSPQDQMATAEARLRTKQLEAAHARAGTANPVEAQITQQARDSALAMAGLSDPESQQQFRQSAESHIAAIKEGATSGDIAAQMRQTQILPKLEELAALDPATAQAFARDLLAQMRQVTQGPAGRIWQGLKVLGTPYGATTQAATNAARQQMAVIERRLQSLAGAQPK